MNSRINLVAVFVVFSFLAVSVLAGVKLERFQKKDVEIFYSWREAPEVYKEVNCTLVKKNGKYVELRIEKEKSIELIDLTKGYVKFIIRDPLTGKVIIKGP